MSEIRPDTRPSTRSGSSSCAAAFTSTSAELWRDPGQRRAEHREPQAPGEREQPVRRQVERPRGHARERLAPHAAAARARRRPRSSRARSRPSAAEKLPAPRPRRVRARARDAADPGARRRSSPPTPSTITAAARRGRGRSAAKPSRRRGASSCSGRPPAPRMRAISAAETKNDAALTAKNALTGSTATSAAATAQPPIESAFVVAWMSAVRLLDVAPADERRHASRRTRARSSSSPISSTKAATTSATSGRCPVSPSDRDRDERGRADEVGRDHQPLAVAAVGGDAAVEAEDERGDAVREPDRDHAERAARDEREPHQRDVVQRVAELARARSPRRAGGSPGAGAGRALARAAAAEAARAAAPRGSRSRDRPRATQSAGARVLSVTVATACSLTGDDLTVEDVWAVAVEGGRASLSGARARARARRARGRRSTPPTASASTRTASTPASAASSRARSRRS